MKRDVFAFVALCRRRLELDVPREREYDLLKSRVSMRSGLVVWSLNVGLEVYYQGVFVLREKRFTMGEIVEWCGDEVEVVEPRRGEKLEEFLELWERTDRRVSIGDSVWKVSGKRILVEEGDEEELEKLEQVGLSWGKSKLECLSERVERLRMRSESCCLSEQAS